MVIGGRNGGMAARWMLAMLLSACSIHEHELTPVGKDAQGPGAAGGADGIGGASGSDPGGAAGTTAGGAAGTAGGAGGAAGTAVPEGGAGTLDGGPPLDAPLDGSICIRDCPPTVCGTISNECGATLACGPCQLSSTFANVADVTLITPRYAPAIARIGNFVYVIGGFNDGMYLSSVERASVDADGNLSTFSDAGVTLVLGRSGHTALFINQQLYVIGGLSIAYTPTVERASVDGNGNLRAFSTVSGVRLTTARGAHGSTVIGHNDYVIGGSDTFALDSLESATFSSNGDLSTFTPVTGVSLVTKRLGFGSVNIGGWIYVVGGATDLPSGAGSTPKYLTSFERAPFDSHGLTGTFQSLPSVSLAVPRYKSSAFAFGPNLYAIGGTNDPAGTLASVERGTIDANGEVTGPFTVSDTIALSTPRAGAVFLVIGPWLYAIGGHGNFGDLNTVERAAVQ
jgi:hypothetical protein